MNLDIMGILIRGRERLRRVIRLIEAGDLMSLFEDEEYVGILY
ncbi:MAG: hypothetical protein US89_C0002G0012 [Candidatus Peregrinibacteria bacterium GW2011_GWF2_38_29]|nr:MAG: hypothetical protein US89_C0002G0012 [Candidatus Peregrinibacteria bacterium GW2011_GWF2_38_29]